MRSSGCEGREGHEGQEGECARRLGFSARCPRTRRTNPLRSGHAAGPSGNRWEVAAGHEAAKPAAKREPLHHRQAIPLTSPPGLGLPRSAPSSFDPSKSIAFRNARRVRLSAILPSSASSFESSSIRRLSIRLAVQPSTLIRLSLHHDTIHHYQEYSYTHDGCTACLSPSHGESNSSLLLPSAFCCAT